MSEQLTFDLFAAQQKPPDQCAAIAQTVDMGGTKVLCAAYGEGETWTNCMEMGHCTLGCGPR